MTQDRARGYLDAVALVGIGDRPATYAAGRATLCGSPDDLARYDQVFDAWFAGTNPRRRCRAAAAAAADDSDADLARRRAAGDGEEDGEGLRAAASAPRCCATATSRS